MDELYNKHYVTVDDQGRITDGWSDGPKPEKDTSEAVCINNRGDYQFRLFPGGNKNPSLFTKDLIPLYKLVNGEIIKRTDNEIEEDRKNISPAPPSNAERLDAQVTYTAIMTDTLLGV